MYLKGFSGMSNSIDPDQMSRYLIFDLGLHSLLRSVCPKSVQQEGSTYLPWTPGIIPPPLCLSLSLSLSLSSLSLHENMLRYILETLLVGIFIDTKIVSACLRACVRAIHTRTRERAHAHTQAC